MMKKYIFTLSFVLLSTSGFAAQCRINTTSHYPKGVGMTPGEAFEVTEDSKQEVSLENGYSSRIVFFKNDYMLLELSNGLSRARSFGYVNIKESKVQVDLEDAADTGSGYSVFCWKP